MSRFGIVIDENGFKVEFVCITEKGIQHYELQENEKVIETDWKVANTMIKPQWTGSEWIESDSGTFSLIKEEGSSIILGEFSNNEKTQEIVCGVSGFKHLIAVFLVNQQLVEIKIDAVSVFEDGEIFFDSGRVLCSMIFNNSNVTIDSNYQVLKLVAIY